MRSALLLAAVLCATALPARADAPAATAPVQIVVLDLEAQGIEQTSAGLVNGAITAAAARVPGVAVLSAADLRNLVNVESDRQALGCDSSSCLGEVASAMGAAYVVFGQVGAAEGVWVLQLSLFDAAKGSAIQRSSEQASSFKGILDAAPRATWRLLAPIAPGAAALVVEDAPVVERPAPILPWALVAGGALGGVAGVVVAAIGLWPAASFYRTQGALRDLQSGTPSLAAVEEGIALQKASDDDDRRWRTWGAATTVVGAVLLVGGVAAVATGGALLATAGGDE